MSVKVVLGAQWGDEGKGKVTDLLAAEADMVIRYQGGNNAGHTVVVGRDEFKLHLIPSGILHPTTICIMADGTVLDLSVLAAEHQGLEERGVSCDNLRISGGAHVIMPYHRLLDGLDEDQRGGSAVGTTRRGIGPAYSDKAFRCGIRLWDLADRQRFAERVRVQTEYHNMILALYDHDPLDPQAVEHEVWAAFEQIKDHLADTHALVREALRERVHILCEGAQGTFLDLDYGTYPYVTSSHPVSGGACLGTGIPPTAIAEVIAVTKAYQTRVGHGVFPTELEDEIGRQMRERGAEYGTTTGRPRRCGWLDVVMLRAAAQWNGATSLAITKLDVLDEFETIRIAVAYRLNGDTHEHLPGDLSLLEQVEPVYEDLPGWQQPVGDCREWEDLPDAARRYLERISELVEVPLGLISVGPSREQTVIV